MAPFFFLDLDNVVGHNTRKQWESSFQSIFYVEGVPHNSGKHKCSEPEQLPENHI
jgi:hypothetical protein